ncbi:uncharacterized protein ELE39_000224 [Cryptosporidium sp. chipmunk genotype I]|uniref:uncharacterized protein n=1 Tax=Cryptosporidium sp. chipmunk genotype I TaxID=1280935 RepID=UPI00351A5096|nr:hypothetical protein ELE39_000224 [Cryptosporidium sp. chipmunk genotype I]
MKGKCIKKIFTVISQNEIEFKLAISAILLEFEDREESLNHKDTNYVNESSYILKIIMTSFNPIELTTKLGGPWEGYFLWDIIRGKILSDRDKVSQKYSLLNFLEMIDDNSSSENLFSFNLMKYCEYMDKIPNTRPFGNTFDEHTKEKDYILAIKLQEIDSEIILHLRSTFNNNIKNLQALENINIITCLKEMVELIKLENFNLHENLRNLAEFNNNNNNNKVVDGRENHQEQDEEESQKIANSYDNITNQLHSPNTRGTLELSELRVPSYLNHSHENNNSPFIDKQNNDINIFNSKLSGSDLLHSQIKAYRFIKDSSKTGNYQYSGSHSTSSLPAYYSSFSSSSRTNGKNSALRSAIDSVRRTQNNSISRHTSALSNRFNFNDDHDDFYNYRDYAPKYNSTITSEFESDNHSYYRYFQKLNKSIQRKNNYEKSINNNYHINDWNESISELKSPTNKRKITPLYTREQLMSKLSNTKDISERINILKSMIKSTKKESYYIDEFG